MKNYIIYLFGWISFGIVHPTTQIICDSGNIQNNFDLSVISIINEINYLRTNPKDYIKILENKLLTQRGKDSVNSHQAIRVLNELAPMKELIFSRALSQAALDHCKDMSVKSFFNHLGSDGSHFNERISKYATNFHPTAENICGMKGTAREVVIDWLLSKGHRENLLSDAYYYIGIAWQTHNELKYVTTIVFGGRKLLSKITDDNVIMECHFSE